MLRRDHGGFLKHQDGVLTMASPSKMFFNRKNMGLGRNMEFLHATYWYWRINIWGMISCRCLHHAGLSPSWGMYQMLFMFGIDYLANFNNPKLGSNLPEIWFWFIPAHETVPSKRWKKNWCAEFPWHFGAQAAGESQFSPIKIAIWGGNTWNTWFSDTVIFPWSRKTSMAKKNTKYFFSMMSKSPLNTTKVKFK